MGKRRFVPLAIIAAALVVMAGIVFGSGSTAAQTGTPATGMMEDHPAHIHSGTCDTLGDVVYPLNNVSAANLMASPMAGMATPMMAMATPMAGMGPVVASSTTDVQAALSDLTGGQYAINVHESADQIQNYIACGEVTGTPAGNSLTVMLNELNGSGYQGWAVLQDHGDGTTTVTVMLTRTTGGAMATPTS